MNSSNFGKLLLVAFLLSYFVWEFLPRPVLDVYAWALIIGLGVFFYLRSKKKKRPTKDSDAQ